MCPAFVDTTLLQTIEQEDYMGKYVKFKDEIKQRMDKFGVLKLVCCRSCALSVCTYMYRHLQEQDVV